jgi:GT2 family glycosyltransferase
VSTVGLGVLCHGRPKELATAVASATGFDEILVLDMASDPPLRRPSDARLVREPTNTGVAAGRNRLVELMTSDIVVFLDDDAVLLTDDTVPRVRESFAADPNLAVVAFRIVRGDGSSKSPEHPFRGAPHDVERRRPCAYFLGGACAIRRDAFNAAGGFDDRFRYSTEEIDLAMTLTTQGYGLVYEPAVVVEHRPSERGRSPDAAIPALRLRNRLLLVRRHLPYPLAVVHAGAWALRTGVEAARVGGLTQWRSAWHEGLTQPVRRAPLSYRKLATLHRRGGRVLW